MKVLMIGQHVNFFRNLDSVMRELCRRGHEVVFLHGTRLDDARVAKKLAQDSKKRMLGRGLQVAQSEIAGVTSGYRPEPAESWPRASAQRPTGDQSRHLPAQRTIRLPSEWSAASRRTCLPISARR